MKKQIVLLTLVLISFLMVQSVSALIIYLRPPKMILRTNVTSGQTSIVEGFLVIKNPNNETINVTFQPKDDIKDITYMKQDTIVLEPNEEKNAEFSVGVSEPGTYSGKISVIYSSESSRAVMLDAEVTVLAQEIKSEENNIKFNPLLIIGFIFFFIIILVYWFFKRGRSQWGG